MKFLILFFSVFLLLTALSPDFLKPDSFLLGVLAAGFRMFLAFILVGFWLDRSTYFGNSKEEPDDFELKRNLCRVKQVIDGDSLRLEVLLPDPDDPEVIEKSSVAEFEARLEHIDAPEMKQPGGAEARKHLVGLLEASEAFYVTASEFDQYNRCISTLHRPDGLCINEAMVADGYAMAYPFGDSSLKPFFKSLQMRASENRLGLWADGLMRQAPWEYRKEKV